MEEHQQSSCIGAASSENDIDTYESVYNKIQAELKHLHDRANVLLVVEGGCLTAYVIMLGNAMSKWSIPQTAILAVGMIGISLFGWRQASNAIPGITKAYEAVRIYMNKRAYLASLGHPTLKLIDLQRSEPLFHDNQIDAEHCVHNDSDHEISLTFYLKFPHDLKRFWLCATLFTIVIGGWLFSPITRTSADSPPRTANDIFTLAPASTK